MATPKNCFRVCGLQEYSVLLVMEWMHNIYLCCSASASLSLYIVVSNKIPVLFCFVLFFCPITKDRRHLVRGRVALNSGSGSLSKTCFLMLICDFYGFFMPDMKSIRQGRDCYYWKKKSGVNALLTDHIWAGCDQFCDNNFFIFFFLCVSIQNWKRARKP